MKAWCVLLLQLLLRTVTSVEGYCAPGDENCSEDELPCSLFLAPSTIPDVEFGLFTSVDIPAGGVVGDPELIIPLIDKFKTTPYRGQHRWLSWLNYVRGTTTYRIPKNEALNDLNPKRLLRSDTGPQFVDDLYKIDAFAPGIPSMAIPHPKYHNVALRKSQVDVDSAGLHRNKDPGVGAFSAHHGAVFVAEEAIKAGSELFISATDEQEEEGAGKKKTKMKITPKWLQKNGICMDNIHVDKSTVKEAGRGAFAKHTISEGALISKSPVAVIKRSDLTVYEINELATNYESVLNKDVVTGTELILNYCYGHPQSDLLLLPVAPGVNFINHNNEPNAEIRWAYGSDKWLKKHPLDMIDLSGTPVFEFVALREIKPGEEIFINYGTAWEDEWHRHAKAWEPNPVHHDWIPAVHYLEGEELDIRTAKEQRKYPYPSNLQTACQFPRKNKKTCWLPCDINERIENETNVTYSVSYSLKRHAAVSKHMSSWDTCGMKAKKVTVDGLEDEFITIIDKWQGKDHHIEGALRHEMGVPQGFYPDLWFESMVYEVAPLAQPLMPGELLPISFKHTRKPITRNAYFIGLPTGFNAHMRDFAENVGAMDVFRDVLNGRYNEMATHRYTDLKEGEWYVQRPWWNSNMHWVIPNDEVARKAYLRALGRGGFRTVLDTMGTTFGFEKMTCFHNTMLGISKADDSNIHADFYETQRRSFDFLLPIITANSTKHELHLQSADGNVLVGVKYQVGVAVVLGDWTYHKSAPCDYIDKEEIRVVCSIYCAEITKENRQSILKMYNEEHPAPFHHLMDVPVEEWHWDKDGGGHLPM